MGGGEEGGAEMKLKGAGHCGESREEREGRRRSRDARLESGNVNGVNRVLRLAAL